MPISQLIVKNSVSANYWVVQDVEYLPRFLGARAFLKGFATSGAFLSGATPLLEEQIILSDSNNPLHRKAIINLVQSKLIVLPGCDLSGGSIVI